MSRKQIALLLTLLLGVFMGALDIFIVAPALGAIQAGLHTTARTVTWSFTAYTLVLVVTQPLVGKLSDRLGRRWVYIACVLAFGLGSAICATSTAFGPFIIGRGLQALGAGGILPVASAVIADTFPMARRGAALGIVGSVFGVAFIVGPLVGGALTGGLRLGPLVTGWRSIFLVNPPLAALIVLLAIRTLPLRTSHPTKRMTFDWYGAALLALILFCLVFGLTQLDFSRPVANFTNEAAVPIILIGLALCFPFWLNEQRVADPIVAPRVFRRPQLILAMLLSIGAGIVTTSIVFVPQLVEAELHVTKPGAGGFDLIWVALTLTLGTPITGRLIDRVGSRAVLLLGGAMTASALAALLLFGSSDAGIVISLLLLGLGLSTFVGTPLRYIVVNEAPPDRRASSLAVLTVCNSVGQTIVLPLGGALIASAIATVPIGALDLRAVATIHALHMFYAVILALVTVALFLTFNLKSHAAELTDRRVRQQIRSHPSTTRALPQVAPRRGEQEIIMAQ